MQYQRFDPSDCDFPKPRVPMLPLLSRDALGGWQASTPRVNASDANPRFFSRARYALLQAYLQSGVGTNGALMAPAYHCRTMLDPAIRLGAKVVLYRLSPDLSPDLQALKLTLDASQEPVKALLVTHYFGFTQALGPLAHFCAQNGITLIEDCSHTLWVTPGADAKNAATGTTGQFCVASPYKFFPCEDGGLLWTNNGAAVATQQPSTTSSAQEIKSLLCSFLPAPRQYRAPDVATLNHEINALTRKTSSMGRDLPELSPLTSNAYVVGNENKAGLAWSRWVMSHSNLVRLVNRRRQNYQQWATAVANLPHCRSLAPLLPQDCVPYMFPLYINHPDPHFFVLKRLGVPIGRWDDMAISGCRIASRYRLNLLHFPCHQELSARQMTWMTTAVKKVMLDVSPSDK